MDFSTVEHQQALKERLKHEVVLVSFLKANGERRDMECTLDVSRIPDQGQPKEGKAARPVSTTSLPVFDTKQNAWRSFRWDSIIEIDNVPNRTYGVV